MKKPNTILRTLFAWLFLYVLTLIPHAAMRFAILRTLFAIAPTIGYHTMFWCVALSLVLIAVLFAGRR